jgi:hypothetical protein
MSQAHETGLDLNVALDAVFKRNTRARPQAIALADPPDRSTFTDGPPRRLSYAGADAAVDGLTRQLGSLGLPSRAVVAVQLPNIVEAAIVLLAVERADLIAAPVPLLWRKSDLVRALAPLEPACIITVARAGDVRPAAVACEIAAELISLSFPCAFGAELPDGMIALDIDTEPTEGNAGPLPVETARAADAISLVTFGAAPDGPFAVGRTQAEWIAAGLSTLIAARIASSASIVSTLPLSSLAGIGAAFVPWLLTGGTLQLVHGFAPQTIERMGLERPHLVAPAGALAALLGVSEKEFSSIIAVHRGPPAPFDPDVHAREVVDFHVLGEIGAVALHRAGDRPAPIPVGRSSFPGQAEAPVGIETRLEPDGTVSLRGAMVPHQVFASGSKPVIGKDGFVPTHYHCRVEGMSVVIDSGPASVAVVGGLRFGLDDLKARIEAVAAGATVSYNPDAVLGGRLVVEVDDPAAASVALEAAGFARVVVDAVAPRAETRRMAG